MPPKKKRGGGSARGRRGRPPKNGVSPAETVSPLPDLIETSNSSSPMSEENGPVEARAKIETKMHKKFGIKYHIPDEIRSPSSTSQELNVSTASSDLIQPQREDVEMKLEQFEVEASAIEFEVVAEEVLTAFDSHSTDIQEYIETEAHLVQDDESPDVYYVLEEPDENCDENLILPIAEIKTESIENEIKNESETHEAIEVKTEELWDMKPMMEMLESDAIAPAIPAIKSKAALKEYSIEEQIQALSEGALPKQEQLSTSPATSNTANNKVKVTKSKKSKEGKKISKCAPKKLVKNAAKTLNKKNTSNDESGKDPNVRRSNRIKTIQKVRSRGKGLVKKDGEPDTKPSEGAIEVFVAPSSEDVKPVKVKSRWRRSSELEMRDNGKSGPTDDSTEQTRQDNVEIERRLKQFAHLRENFYLTDRISCKEAKKMVCDCFLTKEEIDHGEYGCGDDCLNRLLMIECGDLCAVGERCTNKRFQRFESAQVEAFCTNKKGLGIRAVSTILCGDFILEYVGEVLDRKKFMKRATEYSKDKNQHYYFMSLRAEAVIDATMKGNISRFINHSCEPNAETQKWTVNGELRIGFFSKQTIQPGEEITFDYQFERYGKDAQKCFCEAPTCRGWLGEEPDEDDDDDEEEEEEDEDEEEEDAEVVHQMPEMKIKKKAAAKQEKRIRKRRERRMPRKDIFEDAGIDDEIDSLQQSGLKNQAHTLKLSRLMVRAKESTQRIKVLKLLKKGEFPCRRLFLDYHGLRLIYGWMTDAQQMTRKPEMYPFADSLKLEILQTLAMLPIPNKTMLKDSKVLHTVKKWSAKEELKSPDSNSNENSPQTGDQDEVDAEEKHAQKAVADDDEIRRSAGIDDAFTNLLPEGSHASLSDELLYLFSDEFAPLDVPVKQLKPLMAPEPQIDLVEEIIALARKLLEEWSILKEVFRIPKMERIEQMKEHEREADLRFQASNVEAAATTDRRRDRYRNFSTRNERKEHWQKNSNERFVTKSPAMSKHERRELFARQAEEEERRRKLELWKQHYKHLTPMQQPPDPRMAAFDPQRPPYVWNQQLARWQAAEMHHFPRPPGQLDAASLQLPPNMTNAAPNARPTESDPSNVRFVGPIPRPFRMPANWRCAKDKYGRPYYYHCKIRKSQWEPPCGAVECVEEDEESASSSDTSSLSSSSASEDSESDDDMQLIIDIQTKIRMEAQKKLGQEELYPPLITTATSEESPTAIKPPEDVESSEEVQNVALPDANGSIMICTDEVNHVDAAEVVNISLEQEKEIICEPLAKKRRMGLVQQLIISPRSEEDRLQYREDARKYKFNKEMVRKEKELLVKQEKAAKAERVKVPKKVSSKVKLKEMEANANIDEVKKVKETFRSAMATVMVNILNPYRRADCKEGRITSTEDFKHLARKLTHFVMLKELKHCDRLQDLECTESVKLKAKEFVRKYMCKFGEVYHKPPDDIDNFN